MNILIADCVSAYRKVVASRLRAWGAEVVETESGSGVTKAMQDTSFEFVIIDNYLIERSNEDLFSIFRETKDSMRVILMVGPNFDLGSAQKFCQENGITRLIRGPAHPDDLTGQVEALLSEDRPSTAAEIAADQFSEQSVPSMEPDEDLQVHLTEVRRSYQERISGELEKIETSLKQYNVELEDKEMLREAHRLAHALHGTAGTLGFAEISRSAGMIEENLKQVLGEESLNEEIWAVIYRELERAKTTPERVSLVDTTIPQVSGIATVLFVEEDPEIIASTELLAHKNLITLMSARGHENALERARDKRLDGAIIDLNLGGGDSAFQLAQELRSLEGHYDLPIAIMSTDGSIPNRVAAAHAGAAQFLQKPLSADELVDAVRYFNTVRTSISSKVLIVDDDEHFRAHIAAILKGEGMEVNSLGEPELILEVIDSFNPDILLLDVMMPKVSGFDVCRMLRSTAAWKDLPILFLTAESAPEVRLECFVAGADDYIEKPVIREELLARIGVRLERIRLFRERADRDGLTNLPNRRAFLDLFKIRVAEGQRYGRPVSLCIIDLDRFKHINDQYGHLAGDRVLSGMGKLLSSRFRTVDVRGRWGGEEFAVVFYGEDPPTAKMILSRVLDEFKKMTFEGDHGEKFNVSFSCGISAFPKDGLSFDELFRTADEKLYMAKESGRSCIKI